MHAKTTGTTGIGQPSVTRSQSAGVQNVYRRETNDCSTETLTPETGNVSTCTEEVGPVAGPRSPSVRPSSGRNWKRRRWGGWVGVWSGGRSGKRARRWNEPRRRGAEGEERELMKVGMERGNEKKIKRRCRGRRRRRRKRRRWGSRRTTAWRRKYRCQGEQVSLEGNGRRRGGRGGRIRQRLPQGDGRSSRLEEKEEEKKEVDNYTGKQRRRNVHRLSLLPFFAPSVASLLLLMAVRLQHRVASVPQKSSTLLVSSPFLFSLLLLLLLFLPLFLHSRLLLPRLLNSVALILLPASTYRVFPLVSSGAANASFLPTWPSTSWRASPLRRSLPTNSRCCGWCVKLGSPAEAKAKTQLVELRVSCARAEYFPLPPPFHLSYGSTCPLF